MAIHLENISFSFPEEPENIILKISQWNVGSGEHVFIHGPSGSGKSTLLNILSGMLEVNKGEISILGERLDLMKSYQRDAFRAQHIGYVFQQFNLIPYLSPIENIRLSLHFSKKARYSSGSEEQIKALLSVLQVNPSDWSKASEKLSIGQQQRVAIARALIHQPEILIADEPTSSLDQKNRDNFMSVLKDLTSKQETTLIFVSHDISLSKHFHRVDQFSDISSAGRDQ